MRTLVVAIAALGAAGCGRSSRSVDPELADAAFDRVPVDTGGAHGLSGLAVDDTGALWMVAERGGPVLRVELTPGLDGVQAVERLAVTGVPDGVDLEGLAWLGGDRLAIGTEGRQAGVASVLLAELRAGVGGAPRTVVVTETIALPEALVGVAIKDNHGVEGVCAASGELVVALETVGTEAGRRWAPVVRMSDSGADPQALRLWLTTATGKISGLDCWPAPGGGLEVVAIERHFEITHVIGFALPARGGPAAAIEPHVVVNLAPALRGALNLEGIARVGGRAIAVVDNQYGGLQGPDELLVLAAEPIAP